MVDDGALCHRREVAVGRGSKLQMGRLSNFGLELDTTEVRTSTSASRWGQIQLPLASSQSDHPSALRKIDYKTMANLFDIILFLSFFL